MMIGISIHSVDKPVWAHKVDVKALSIPPKFPQQNPLLLR